MFEKIKDWLEVRRFIKTMEFIDKLDNTSKNMLLMKYSDDELRNELVMRQFGKYLGYFDDQKKISENLNYTQLN